MSEPEEPEPYVPRRRRKKGISTGVVVFVTLLAIVAIAAVIAATLRTSGTNSTERKATGKIATKAKVRPKAEDEADEPKEPQWAEKRRDVISDRLDDVDVRDVVLLVIVIPFYLAPSIIAIIRKHNNLAPILLINILLGCLCVGWVASLAWALTDLSAARRRDGPY